MPDWCLGEQNRVLSGQEGRLSLFCRRGMLMELEKNWSRLWPPGWEAGRLACNFFWNGQVETAFASSGKRGKFM